MTTTQQPMKLAMKCVYCGSVKHEAREASGTCIQELIYALNDSVKREQVLRDALDWMIRCHTRDTDNDPNWQIQDQDHAVERARAALAATEVKP
jgi:hypothetical protein